MWHEDDDGLSHLGFMFKDDQVFDNVNSKGEDMKWWLLNIFKFSLYYFKFIYYVIENILV